MLSWLTTLRLARLVAVTTRMPPRFSCRSDITSAMRSRTARKAMSEAFRNHSVSTSITGTTPRNSTRASVGLTANSTTATMARVRNWTNMLTRPSWNRAVSDSMSLVMRVISTPPFSAVKKLSDRRWKWEKIRMRSVSMSASPTRPVQATRAADRTVPMTTEPT